MEIYWICSGGCRRQRVVNSIEEGEDGDLIFGGELIFFLFFVFFLFRDPWEQGKRPRFRKSTPIGPKNTKIKRAIVKVPNWEK